MTLRNTDAGRKQPGHARLALDRAQDLADASFDGGYSAAWFHEAERVGDLSALASALLAEDPR